MKVATGLAVGREANPLLVHEAVTKAMQQAQAGCANSVLLFSCISRGTYFYGGMGRDLELLRKQFPQMPLIGFYGNGEIAPMNGVNELLQYSAVLGLFVCDPEAA